MGTYDLAIIGSGAAGIACAKRAIQSNLRTVLIDKAEINFGGTCLNSGCIPTKFFINSLKSKESWQKSFKDSLGVVDAIKSPLLNYLKSQGVYVIWGEASFLDKNNLKIGDVILKAKNIIIATGSLPREIDNPEAIPAQNLFNQADVGKRVCIIGGGYIGIELASLLSGFGKDVCLLEKEKNILPNFDQYLASRLKVILAKKGIKIETGKDFSEHDLSPYDDVFFAVGRKANLKGLDVEKIGVVTEKGWIKTDSKLKTNVENIYSCGDVNGKKLLAYIAEYQANICISNIAGEAAEEDYFAVPECVFSLPQVAKVGLLEEDLKDKGIEYKVFKSNFLKYSSAYVYNDKEGFIKIITDKENRIIGAGIISQFAGELISILSLCVKNKLTIDNLRKCLFVHPTLSEIIPQVFDR